MSTSYVSTTAPRSPTYTLSITSVLNPNIHGSATMTKAQYFHLEDRKFEVGCNGIPTSKYPGISAEEVENIVSQFEDSAMKEAAREFVVGGGWYDKIWDLKLSCDDPSLSRKSSRVGSTRSDGLKATLKPYLQSWIDSFTGSKEMAGSSRACGTGVVNWNETRADCVV